MSDSVKTPLKSITAPYGSRSVSTTSPTAAE